MSIVCGLTNNGDGTLRLSPSSMPAGTVSWTHEVTAGGSGALVSHSAWGSGFFYDVVFVKVNVSNTITIKAYSGANGSGTLLETTTRSATPTINPPTLNGLTNGAYVGASWGATVCNNPDYSIGSNQLYYSLNGGATWQYYGNEGAGAGSIPSNALFVGYNTSIQWQDRVDVVSATYSQIFSPTSTITVSTGSPPPAPPATPNPPTALTATDNGANVVLNWAASVGGATSYEVSLSNGHVLGHTSALTFTDTVPGTRPLTYRVRAYNSNAGGTSYSSYVTVVTALNTPTNVTPVAGATINTDYPTLGLTIPAGSVNQKPEWQLAKDSAFTVGLIDVVVDDSQLVPAGTVVSHQLSGLQKLSQAVWYMRARVTAAGGASASSWTATQSFTVTHPPTSSGLSPTGGGYQVFGTGDVTFSWNFNSTSPPSTQTAYEIVVQRASDSLVIVDTGKIVSTAKQAVINIPATYKDVDLQWQIKLWDNDDVAGPYSAWQVWRLGDAPVIAITAPANNSTVVDTTNPTVTWTFAASGGRTEASYRIQFLHTVDGVMLYDTGTVAGTDLTFTPPTGFLDESNELVTVILTVVDTGNLSTQVTSTFTFTITPPISPDITLDVSFFATKGYAELTWDSRDKDPEFYAWRVYRRLSSDTAWTLVEELTDQSYNMTYTDYLAASNYEQDWAVVQVSNKFGSTVEGNYNFRTATPLDDHYWIIVSNSSDQNFRLAQVTDDSYSEEYEEVEVHLLGRGRHMEYGDRLGFAGTMTAKLRDQLGLSARTQRQRLLAIKANQSSFYLRNPFGDVWLIAASSITVTRIAGVGAAEFVDVTVPYAEVAH